MKLKTNALQVIQGIMISLAVIAIIVVVVLMIIQGQIDAQTANSSTYNALVSLRTQVTSTITWVGIAVTVAIGFALIAMFYKK